MSLQKEEALQIAVADYIRYQYPKVLFCHVANERKTSKGRGGKLKAMGVRSGMPDVMIFKMKPSPENDSDRRVGLAIELKIKPNAPTENQVKCLEQLEVEGWEVHVIYDFDSARKIIDDYLK